MGHFVPMTKVPSEQGRDGGGRNESCLSMRKNRLLEKVVQRVARGRSRRGGRQWALSNNMGEGGATKTLAEPVPAHTNLKLGEEWEGMAALENHIGCWSWKCHLQSQQCRLHSHRPPGQLRRPPGSWASLPEAFAWPAATLPGWFSHLRWCQTD